MKRFVREKRWEPIAVGLVILIAISFAKANEWMYAILYPLFFLWLGWPYLTSRRRTQRADWRRPQ
jgi:hypothetical protein